MKLIVITAFLVGLAECHDGKEHSTVDSTLKSIQSSSLDKSSNKTIVCVANRMFIRDCNTCWCNNDGTGFFCTRRICVPEFPEEAAEQQYTKTKSSPVEDKKVVCVANRMFIRDCNTCWCNKDGTGFYCTRRICLPETEELPADVGSTKDLRIVKKECTPNEVFQLDCNMCRCNPDGLSFSCTRRACFQDPPVIEDVQKNSSPTRKTRGSGQEATKKCQPGQSFRLDCNMCLCDNLGQEFSCTRNDCRTENSGRKRRRAPPSWLGLNAVKSKQGTFHPRRLKRSIDNFAEMLPRPTGILLNDDTKYGQIHRLRREVAQQEVSQCTPGSVFEIACNVCRCADDGRHATCTLRSCSLKPDEGKDAEVPEESDPNFRCNPGEQSRRGCNDCTCSADGKSVFCTLRLCEKDLMPKF